MRLSWWCCGVASSMRNSSLRKKALHIQWYENQLLFLPPDRETKRSVSSLLFVSYTSSPPGSDVCVVLFIHCNAAFASTIDRHTLFPRQGHAVYAVTGRITITSNTYYYQVLLNVIRSVVAFCHSPPKLLRPGARRQ